MLQNTPLKFTYQTYLPASYKPSHVPFKLFFFFLNDPAPTEISPLPLPDALPIFRGRDRVVPGRGRGGEAAARDRHLAAAVRARVVAGVAGRPAARRALLLGGRDARDRFGRNRSEEHTSELQSRLHLVCRLLLEKK